jgi:hypothetical protein
MLNCNLKYLLELYITGSLVMAPSKKDTNSLNSIYNPITGMYENATGKFRTYAEARQNKWKCTKCAVMFSSYRLLRDHMKEAR